MRGLFGYLRSFLGETGNPETGEIVKKGLDYAAGLDFPWQNPDELLRKVGRDVRLYDMMLTDDRITFSHELKKRLILAVPAEVKPASDDPKDVEIAEFVASNLGLGAKKLPQDPGFNHTAFSDNALDAAVYGFKVAEVVWDVTPDGKYFIKNIKHRHSYHFDFGYDEFGNLNCVWIGRKTGSDQKVEGDAIYQKLMLYVYPYAKDGNYYGDSDLRELYGKWRSKMHIQRQRDVHLQNWGMPIPVVTYDKASTTPVEKEALRAMLRGWRDSMWLMIPGVKAREKNGTVGELVGQFKLEIKEAQNGVNTDQYERAIDQLDKQITRVYLIPDKMGFSESPGGSYNLGQHQFDLLKAVIKYFHDWLARPMPVLIKQIVDLNYGPQENYPVYQFQQIDRYDPQFIKTLIDAKVIDPEEKWVRGYTGVPTITQQERDEIEARARERQAAAGLPVNQVGPDGKPVPPKPGQPPTPGAAADGDEDDDEPPVPEPKKQRAQRFKDYRRRDDNPFKFKATEKWFDQQEAGFVRDYSKLHRDASAQLVAQIQRKKIVENADYDALANLKITKGPFKDLFTASFNRWFITGKADGIDEIEPRLPETLQRKCKLPRPRRLEAEVPWLDRDYIDKYLGDYGELGELTSDDIAYLRQLRDKGFYISGVEEERMIRACRSVIEEGIRSGKTTADITSALIVALNSDLEKYALTIARTNMADQYNVGRMNFFTSDEVSGVIEGYQYQAIIDDVTTDFCREHDGQVLKAGDPQLAVINPPNHYNCRSTLVPITIGENDDPGSFFEDWKDEFDPFGTGVSADAARPAPGFGG